MDTGSINHKIDEMINDTYFRYIGKPKISDDSIRVAEEFGLKDCLFNNSYVQIPNKIRPQGLIKEFSGMKNEGKLKGIFLFGSLKKGHYVDNLARYECLESQLQNNNQKFWYYSFLGDMFNYPYGSDIDFCFIVSDDYFKSNPDKIKSDFSTILLNHPKYYIEHFSIIPKTQLFNLMESFYNFKSDKVKNEDFDLRFFKINPDYYPSGITETAKSELSKKREDYSKKTIILKEKLNELQNNYAKDIIKSTMIQYSLNRINSGVTCEKEDSFGHERVLKSLPRSYFMNFDPSFSSAINNINNFSIVSNSVEKYLLSFEKELKQYEIKNNTRLNKWHHLKSLRQNYLEEMERKIKKGE